MEPDDKSSQNPINPTAPGQPGEVFGAQPTTTPQPSTFEPQTVAPQAQPPVMPAEPTFSQPIQSFTPDTAAPMPQPMQPGDQPQPPLPAQPAQSFGTSQSMPAFMQPDQTGPAAPQTPSASGGFSSGSQPGSSQSPKGKMFMRLALIIIVLLVLGAAAYLVLGHKSTSKGNAGATNKSAQKSVAGTNATGDLTKLKSFSFVQPVASALNGMIPTASDSSHSDYTTLESSDQKCEIGFGIISQSNMPGTDIGSMLSKKIADVKQIDENIKVTGPNDVSAIVLKGSDNKTYAIPTVNYAYTDPGEGGGSLVENFSAVELADQSHAIVYTICSDETPSDQAALATRVNDLQSVVNAITVKVN